MAALFFVMLLAHELAHAVSAKHHGIAVRSITLWMLGGVTELEGEPADPRADLRIAVVGPLTSLACAAVSAVLAFLLETLRSPAVLTAGAAWLGVTNVLLAGFNLVPAAPLDGGRVLRAVIWRRTGDHQRGALAAAKSGRVTGYVFVWLGLLEVLFSANVIGGLWLALIGWFLVSAAGAEAQSETSGLALAGVRVGDVMMTEVTALPAWAHLRAAANRAVESEQEVFPVVDLDGVVVGTVGVDQLVAGARSLPEPTSVAAVMRPLSPRRAVRPETELVTALQGVDQPGALVVVDEGRPIGLVTPARLNQALRRGLLRTGAASQEGTAERSA